MLVSSPTLQGPLRTTAAVSLAGQRTLRSLCHPSMWLALLLPFLIAVFGACLLLWFFWTPLTEWLRAEAAQWGIINQADDWLMAMGLFSIKVYLAPVMAAIILLPVSGILGLAIAAVFVMPWALHHVSTRDYPDVDKQGQYATVVSVWNVIWVSVLFVGGWLLTLPLWLIPFMGVFLSVFWWTFAFTRMMRVDAIVEHASPVERAQVLTQHGRGFWLIGLICALLNLLPPAWIFLPVFAALFNVHYGLEALRRLRETSAATLALR